MRRRRSVAVLLSGPALWLGAAALVLPACSDDAVTEPSAAPATPEGLPALELVGTGLEVDQPLALVPAPEGDDLLVAERAGRVVAASVDGTDLTAADTPVLDLTEQVGSTDGERGLLGLAVAPDGRHLYASYTRARDGASQVDEFELARTDDGWRADPATRRNLLDVAQPYANHNGGHLEFGPDGALYLGLGDGGAGGDPEGRAQDPQTLLGKLVRLDPRADPPTTEIWASGLRNPWRFSFDRRTDDLWIGDVGQDRTEEIDVLRAADGGGRGANLGWDLYEGDQPFEDPDPAPGGASDGPFVEPVFTYGRDEGCSVTGGVVYRGAALPALDGAYLYADLCGQGVRALLDADTAAEGTQLSASRLTDSPGQIVGFAEDRDGEVYVLSLEQGVLRLRAG